MNSNLINKVKKRYRDYFGEEELLIFAPGRINLIGEHTDYNNGFVFPAAIDKGIVMALGRSNTGHSSIIAMDMAEELRIDLNNLNRDKTNSWKNYIMGVLAEFLKTGKEITNFNCVFSGDIPVGSGLSSSAALENSLAMGCNKLFDLNFDKMELVHLSQKAEHNFVGVNCGIMDQYASMFGKKNHFIFLDCLTVTSELVPVNLRDHEILLINTNVKHALAESGYNDRYAVCQKITKMIGKPSLREVSIDELNSIKTKISLSDYNKGLYILEENNRVLACMSALKANDLSEVGRILFLSHHGQSLMYDISCDELDFLVDQAKQSKEVLGARMMGGGFGGCTINFVKREGVESFKTKITTRYRNRFKKDCSIYHINLDNGTRVI